LSDRTTFLKKATISQFQFLFQHFIVYGNNTINEKHYIPKPAHIQSNAPKE